MKHTYFNTHWVHLAVLTLIMGHFWSGIAEAQGFPEPVLDSNNPDEFAWKLFLYISQPTDENSNEVAWETWATTEDVFSDPNNPPQWPGDALQPEAAERRLTPQLKQQETFRRHLSMTLGLEEEFEAEAVEGGGSEVRMNRSAFDFIVDHDLYYIEGQEEAFSEGKRIDFPADAREIKAVWLPIAAADRDRYHAFESGNQLFGLVALHITSKDVPEWFWGTWEHVDNPNAGVEVPQRDSFGMDDGQVSQELLDLMDEAGLSAAWQKKWKNYRLNGSQINFVDTTGRSTILSSSVIEAGFEQSSCVTCHARAAIGPKLPGFSGANRIPVFPVFVGIPDQNWFYNPPVGDAAPTRKYLQLDFVWSLTNARRRSN